MAEFDVFVRHQNQKGCCEDFIRDILSFRRVYTFGPSWATTCQSDVRLRPLRTDLGGESQRSEWFPIRRGEVSTRTPKERSRLERSVPSTDLIALALLFELSSRTLWVPPLLGKVCTEGTRHLRVTPLCRR